MGKTDNIAVDTGVRTVVDSPSVVAGVVEIANGRWIDLLNPSPEDIHVPDVAISLSRTGRFGGFTKEFYSVACHSLLCVKLAEIKGGTPQQIKAAALHDFHEAYVGDIPTPLKKVLAGWKPIVERLDQVIGERFGIDCAEFESPFVKEIDHIALSLEARDLMHRQTPGFKEILLDDNQVEQKLGAPAPGPVPLEPAAGESQFLAGLSRIGIR